MNNSIINVEKLIELNFDKNHRNNLKRTSAAIRGRLNDSTISRNLFVGYETTIDIVGEHNDITENQSFRNS